MPQGKIPKGFRKCQKKAWLKNKGSKHTKEHKEKIRKAVKNQWKIGIRKGGWKLSKKIKQKMKQNSPHYWLNKKRPNITGSKCRFWKGGITELQYKIRNHFKYRQWRSDVFTRDNFTCQCCGDKKGGNLEAHHLKAKSLIIKENNITTIEQALMCEELWNINNGQTLCEKCHQKTDNYGGKLVIDAAKI